MVTLTVFTLALALAACTGSGGGGGGSAGVSGDNEDKYTQALASINKAWKVSEMKKDKDQTIIRVEVDDNVPFAEGKKAADAIQKADPKFNGYVEFFNGQIGMVIRKLEIFPAT
jgi:hypothetical protein